MPEEKDIQWLLQEKYHGEKSEAFFADCKRLTLGEPLAYLIGWIPFLDCQIWLDSRPLIPRPETEYWVKEAIETIRTSQSPSLGFSNEPPRILDLCAGSGCIGVAVAHALPKALVDFIEIDQHHLATIKKNLAANDIALDRTNISQTHLFTGNDKRYDFILSNPPYIDADLSRVEESVTLHEPHLALFGGHGGMTVIAEIISTAPHHLRTGGQLWLEHEPEQTTAITELALTRGFQAETHQDQYGNERYSILVLQ